MEKLLKPREVAEKLSMSASYVYKLADNRILPCIRFSIPSNGKRKKQTLRFYQRDVEKFKKDHYKPQYLYRPRSDQWSYQSSL